MPLSCIRIVLLLSKQVVARLYTCYNARSYREGREVRPVGSLSWEPLGSMGVGAAGAHPGDSGRPCPHPGFWERRSPFIRRVVLPGLLESSLGCVGEVSLGPASRDHKHADLARPTGLSFAFLLPPSWPLPRSAHKYKTDFVFRMFWSLDSRGCIKAFLWGWLSPRGKPCCDLSPESPRGSTRGMPCAGTGAGGRWPRVGAC